MSRVRLFSSTVAVILVAQFGIAATPAVASLPAPLFEGVLQRVDGSPISGKTVTMHIGPGEKQLSLMSEGDSFKLRSIGRATTGLDGTFQLPMPDSASTPSAPGIYDVTIVALDDGDLLSVAKTSVRATAGHAELMTIDALHSGQEEAAVGSGPSTTLSASMEGPKIESAPGKAPFITMTASTADGPDSGTPQQDPTASSAAVCQDGLKTTLLQSYSNRLTAVGSIHATTNGYKTQFTLSSGSEATLGSAINFGDGWGEANASITRSLQTETEWGARTAAGHRMLQTRYSVGDFETVYGERGVCSSYRMMDAIAHEGGAEANAGSNPTATYCRNYEFDSKITMNEGFATSWHNGFSLENIVGIDVFSTAGYSTSEKIVVEITAPGGRKICGTDKYPGQFPARVVVKPQ